MAMEWIDKARCREVGTDIFYPDPSDPLTVIRAKKVCASCEVQAECLDLGIAETYGIWGGTTENERRQLRKQRKAIA